MGIDQKAHWSHSEGQLLVKLEIWKGKEHFFKETSDTEQRCNNWNSKKKKKKKYQQFLGKQDYYTTSKDHPRNYLITDGNAYS